MKNLKVVLASLFAVVAINSAPAFADNAGYGPCYLNQQALIKKGFSEQAAYKPEAIVRIMKENGITISLETLDPNDLYTLSYNCNVVNGVTYNLLTASAVAETAKVPSSKIGWEDTAV